MVSFTSIMGQMTELLKKTKKTDEHYFCFRRDSKSLKKSGKTVYKALVKKCS